MLLPLDEVARRLGITRMTLHNYRANPAMKFPLAIQVTKRQICILEAELNAWIAARPRAVVRRTCFAQPAPPPLPFPLPLPTPAGRKRATA